MILTYSAWLWIWRQVLQKNMNEYLFFFGEMMKRVSLGGIFPEATTGSNFFEKFESSIQ